MNERIKWVRKNSKDKTLQKFGERIGIAGPSVSLLESGKNNPSKQTVKAICREYGVNEEWLLTGEGEPYVKPDLQDEITELLARVQINAMSGSDAEQKVAVFKERLATAILKLDDESCDALIQLVNDLTE